MRISDWSADVCSSDLVAVVDVLVGNQHPVGIGDLFGPTGDGQQTGQVGRIQLLYRVEQVGIEIDGASLEPKPAAGLAQQLHRSEERRVGKECVSTCSSRWSPDP